MSPQSPDLTATTGVAVEDKALDKESVIDLLGEEDKEQETIDLEPPKKEPKKEEDKPKEEEEEKEPSLEEELEQELEEPDEKDLDLIEPPKRREILAKYPELFKEFPHLERAMYREQKYSALLPTLEDAKLAVERSETLEHYENEVMSGSTESLLATVRENDKEAFAKVVDNYLPTLYKVDQHAYYHTIANVVKHTIISMVRDAKAENKEELEQAASILNKYMFNTTQFTHPQRLSKDEVTDDGSKEREEQVAQREKEFVERQYNTAKDSLGTKVDNVLKASVDKFIDPNDSMTPFVKRTATREVLEGLEDIISRDTRFRAVYDRLWERAFENNFSDESMDTIRSAYLSKAKTLLPLLIKKARNEALRGNRKVNDNDDKDRKGPLPVGKTRTSTSLASGRASGSKDNKQIPRGMTSLEYLNSED